MPSRTRPRLSCDAGSGVGKAMTGGAHPSASAAGVRALGLAGPEADWAAASGGRRSGRRGKVREHGRTSAKWA
jgi:hypothetical protein